MTFVDMEFTQPLQWGNSTVEQRHRRERNCVAKGVARLENTKTAARTFKSRARPHSFFPLVVFQFHLVLHASIWPIIDWISDQSFGVRHWKGCAEKDSFCHRRLELEDSTSVASVVVQGIFVFHFGGRSLHGTAFLAGSTDQMSDHFRDVRSIGLCSNFSSQSCLAES